MFNNHLMSFVIIPSCHCTISLLSLRALRSAHSELVEESHLAQDKLRVAISERSNTHAHFFGHDT